MMVLSMFCLKMDIYNEFDFGIGYDRRIKLKACGIDLDVVMDVVCAHLGLEPAELWSPSRRHADSRFLRRVP